MTNYFKHYYKVTNLYRESVYAGDSFCLTYYQGAIVEALEGTLGVMVFESYANAKEFGDLHKKKPGGYYILQVRGIGKPSVPEEISGWTTGYDLKQWYQYPEERDKSSSAPPPGTVCFQSVEVLT